MGQRSALLLCGEWLLRGNIEAGNPNNSLGEGWWWMELGWRQEGIVAFGICSGEKNWKSEVMNWV